MLNIRLFGTVQVYRDNRRLPGFPTEKSRSLFSYLVLNQSRRYTRERLAGELWGERPGLDVLKCLRTELWRMRRVVEPEQASHRPYFHVDRHKVGFDGDSVRWLDVQPFQEILLPLVSLTGQAFTDSQAKSVNDALNLYHGDLLEDVFDDWPVFERERFRELYINGLEQLTNYHEHRQEWREAILFARRLLNADPLREHIHRQLIRYHSFLGDRPAAFRQYDVCREVLRREFNVEPMEETRRLYSLIVEQKPLSDPSSPSNVDVESSGAYNSRCSSGCEKRDTERLDVSDDRSSNAEPGVVLREVLDRIASAESEIARARRALTRLKRY